MGLQHPLAFPHQVIMHMLQCSHDYASAYDADAPLMVSKVKFEVCSNSQAVTACMLLPEVTLSCGKCQSQAFLTSPLSQSCCGVVLRLRSLSASVHAGG